jgi:hypothetical protein
MHLRYVGKFYELHIGFSRVELVGYISTKFVRVVSGGTCFISSHSIPCYVIANITAFSFIISVNVEQVRLLSPNANNHNVDLLYYHKVSKPPLTNMQDYTSNTYSASPMTTSSLTSKASPATCESCPCSTARLFMHLSTHSAS